MRSPLLVQWWETRLEIAAFSARSAFTCRFDVICIYDSCGCNIQEMPDCQPLCAVPLNGLMQVIVLVGSYIVCGVSCISKMTRMTVSDRSSRGATFQGISDSGSWTVEILRQEERQDCTVGHRGAPLGGRVEHRS